MRRPAVRRRRPTAAELIPIRNQGPLYDHLTGTSNRLLYRQVVAADAVHNMFISNPSGLISALRAMF